MSLYCVVQDLCSTDQHYPLGPALLLMGDWKPSHAPDVSRSRSYRSCTGRRCIISVQDLDRLDPTFVVTASCAGSAWHRSDAENMCFRSFRSSGYHPAPLSMLVGLALRFRPAWREFRAGPLLSLHFFPSPLSPRRYDVTGFYITVAFFCVLPTGSLGIVPPLFRAQPPGTT